MTIKNEDQHTKATVRVLRVPYEKVHEKLHYGQATMLFSNIFSALAIKIDSGQFDEVYDFIYKGKEITLTLSGDD